MNYRIVTSLDGGNSGFGKPSIVDRPTDITFDSDGKPNVITVYLTQVPLIWVDVATDTLTNVGEQQVLQVSGPGAGTVTVKLDSLAATDMSTRMVLAVTYDSPEYASLGAVFTGPCTVNATRQADGKVDWSVDTSLLSTLRTDGPSVSQKATGHGTLTRK